MVGAILQGILNELLAGPSKASETSQGAPPRAEYPIQVLHIDNNAVVDIVAVHGLGANPDYAWVWQPKNNPPGCPGYPKEHYNWLKELLPKELSSVQIPCRVLTFNYDSRWFMDAPQHRLSNISDRLLDSLTDNRKESNRSRLPLIFIGHSFGGNLIEQAIVSASQRGSRNAEIAESTVGFVFFGTPHRGCAAARWGVLVASLLPPSWDSNTNILKNLENSSETLTDRLYQFSSWLFTHSVPVVCCFEEFKTDFSSRTKVPFHDLVVDEASACIDGHPKICLSTDHFKMNKFYGPNDQSFRLVCPRIKEMALNAWDFLRRRQSPKAILTDPKALCQGKLRQCIEWMEVRDPRDILSDIQVQKGERVKDTCDWILKRSEFSGWKTNNDSQMFRIIGSPGMGKTILSTFLVEHLTKTVQESTDKRLAYFFFDDKIQDQRTAVAMLRSLIWQLLLQEKELFKHIEPDFDRQANGLFSGNIFEDMAALWRMLINMLQDERAGETFVVIDALDECEQSTRKDLLTRLKKLFRGQPALKAKFFVTHRPGIRDIESPLRGIGTHLNMEDSGEVEADLSSYIEEKVDELAWEEDYSKSLKEDVKNAFRNQADGTFLWVSLMLCELKEVDQDDVRAKLKDLPKGLDETYARILNKNIAEEKREKARFLLLSMVAAKRPLKRKEIAAAFALHKDGAVLESETLREYINICSSCSSLIYIARRENVEESIFYVADKENDEDELTVNFCHQSVKDFLLKDHCGMNVAWVRTSLDSANLHMFETCWNYLTTIESTDGRWILRRKGDTLVGEFKVNLEPYYRKYPFFKYASQTWEDHAAASYPALLQDMKIDIAQTPALRDAWLIRAAMEGQIDVLKYLLYQHGADPRIAFDNSFGALHIASSCGHREIVQFLFEENQVDVNLKDPNSITALSWAALHGQREIVELILHTDRVDVNLKDDTGSTALTWAAAEGNEEIVKLLLHSGQVDVNTADDWGVTPLIFAAKWKHQGCVRLLLETGQVDIDSEDKDGFSALRWATRNDDAVTLQLLLEMGQAEKDQGLDALSNAVSRGDEGMVQLLLSAGQIDVNSQNRDGRTPLDLAIKYGYKEIVQLLRTAMKSSIIMGDAGT